MTSQDRLNRCTTQTKDKEMEFILDASAVNVSLWIEYVIKAWGCLCQAVAGVVYFTRTTMALQKSDAVFTQSRSPAF